MKMPFSATKTPLPAVKARLTLLYFLQYAVWGVYLTSQGRYLTSVGLGAYIGKLFFVQGMAAFLLPAFMGMVADRLIPPRRLLVLCHSVAGTSLLLLGLTGMAAGADGPSAACLMILYTLNAVCFIPTLSLTNSYTYALLEADGQDPVKLFPGIRCWGTVGFVVLMWASDLFHWQDSALQYAVSGGLSLLLSAYLLTGLSESVPGKGSKDIPGSKPETVPGKGGERASSQRSQPGGRVFRTVLAEYGQLLRQAGMPVFFLCVLLMGAAGKLSDGFTNAYLSDFGHLPAYAHSFCVAHANLMVSLSQLSETVCILFIPFLLQRLGIKRTLMLALVAWALRFGLLGVGNPGDGWPWLALSMLVYGLAFNGFSIAGSLYVNRRAPASIRASAQGLFSMIGSGLGGALGALGAQGVVDHYVNGPKASGADWPAIMQGWSHSWLWFAAYMLAVLLFFVLCFREHSDHCS